MVAQRGTDLYKLLNEADSVQIASHVDLMWMEKVPPFRSGWHQLINYGNINDTIVRERTNINKVAVSELYAILTDESSNKLSKAYCFNPHHSILIYKRGELFAIDICFECKGTAITGELSIPILTNNKSYKDLAEFFLTHKILYKLPKEGMYGY